MEPFLARKDSTSVWMIFPSRVMPDFETQIPIKPQNSPDATTPEALIIEEEDDDFCYSTHLHGFSFLRAAESKVCPESLENVDFSD